MDRASGNGSIMRLAPVPIRYAHFYPAQVDELSRLAEESSLPTHASDQCVSAYRYLASVLAALIHGEDRDTVLSSDWQPLLLPESPRRTITVKNRNRCLRKLPLGKDRLPSRCYPMAASLRLQRES